MVQKFKNLVYFKLFDYDNDDRISPSDVSTIIRILNEADNVPGVDRLKSEINNINHLASIHDKLLNNIFNELIINNKEPYITFSIFKDLMMETNIHKTCVLAFDSDEDI